MILVIYQEEWMKQKLLEQRLMPAVVISMSWMKMGKTHFAVEQVVAYGGKKKLKDALTL